MNEAAIHIDAQIQVRHDIEANWAAVDPVLRDGEVAYSKDLNRIKVGDGARKWSELKYLGGTNGDAATPRQLFFDVAEILAFAGPINRQTREQLYNIFLFTEGNEIPSEPAWVIDTNGQHYIVRMLQTETGVGFFIIGYEGFTRIEGDNTKTNQLLRDKADKKYVDGTFFSQAQFDQIASNQYTVGNVAYQTDSDTGLRRLSLSLELRIQNDIDAAVNDRPDDNGNYTNGLVTALGVKNWVEGKGYLTSAAMGNYATKDDIKDFVTKGTTLEHYGITDAVKYAIYFPALTTDTPKTMGYCRLADGWKLTGPAMILGTNNYYARIQADTSSMDNPALYLSVVHAGVEYGWAQVVTDKNFSAYGLAMKTHQNGIDLNEIEVGLYDLAGAISNSPLNYGSLLNIKGYFSAQLLFNASGDAVYYRTKSDREVDGTKWRPWRTIIDSNNVSSYVHTAADSRYLKLSGGTLTGQLYVETSAGDRYIHSKCSTAHIAFGVGSGGNNRGIFDIKDGKWWILRNNSDYTEIVSSTMALVGNVRVTGVLEAQSGITLGNITRTSWPTEGIAKNSMLLPNNAFDSLGKIQFSQLDNALYAADRRFNVTVNGFASDTKTVLFNGSYEDSIQVPMGQTATIKIDNNGNDIISGYPYGKIILSFYYQSVPESVSIRVYTTYGTAGWYSLPLSEKRGTNGGVFVFDNSNYAVKEVEITITAKSDINAALSEIDWFLNRASLSNLPVVTKFAIDQELYGRLICKGGITLGNKTITSWDDIKASGDYLPLTGGTINGELKIAQALTMIGDAPIRGDIPEGGTYHRFRMLMHPNGLFFQASNYDGTSTAGKVGFTGYGGNPAEDIHFNASTIRFLGAASFSSSLTLGGASFVWRQIQSWEPEKLLVSGGVSIGNMYMRERLYIEAYEGLEARIAFRDKNGTITDSITTFDDLRIKVAEQTATSGVSIAPNVLNKWTTPLTGALTINFSAGRSTVANYYMIEFKTGDTVPTISLPSGITWQNGDNILERLEPNKTYQISILNYLAVGGAF